MKPRALSPSVERLIEFLGELGSRWGNPAIPCRVHGYLYLVARPVEEEEICQLLDLDHPSLEEALAWLKTFGLIEAVAPDKWRTDSDPWNVMMRVLEERRRRELVPALELLRECNQTAAREGPGDRTVGLQIRKLLALVEDLAAIDSQAGRLSPKSLRQFVRIGGRAARFLDRNLGKDSHR